MALDLSDQYVTYNKYLGVETIDKLRIETKFQTRLLWHCGYWDGPMNGVMLWKGQMCWFQSCDSCYLKVKDPEINEDDTDLYDNIMIRFYKVYEVPHNIWE